MPLFANLNMSNAIRRLIPLFVALILGSVAAFLTKSYIEKKEIDLQRILAVERESLKKQYQLMSPNMVEVVIANNDIGEGTTVTAGMLTRRAVPEDFREPYTTEKEVDFIGLITAAPVARGEQIQRNKLRQASEVIKASSLSEVTPDGQRAVTIGTDALTGVGGFVRPGDFVDVLWTLSTVENDSVTLTLFQRIRVLAVGNQMVGDIDAEVAPIADYTVTLSLTPQETTLLLFARREGVIQLSLRPRNDSNQLVDINPINKQTVLRSLLGHEDVRKATSHRTIEVIRGLERSIVSVSDYE